MVITRFRQNLLFAAGFLFLFNFSVRPQLSRAQYRDSLIRLLPKTKDTAAVNLLNLLANSQDSEPRSKLHYAMKAAALAKRLHWDKGLADSYNFIGIAYTNMSNYPKSLEYFFMTITAARAAKNLPAEASALINIGNIYGFQKNYDKALKYYNQALVINEETKNDLYAAVNLGCIGDVLYNKAEDEKAIGYYLRALKLGTLCNNADVMSNQMLCLGRTFAREKKYAVADSYFQQSIGTARKASLSNIAAIANGDLGQMHIQMAKDLPAKDSRQRRILLLAEHELRESTSALFQQEDLDNYQIYQKALSEAYSLEGNYRMALEAYRSHSKFKDSVFNESKVKEITQREMSYAYSRQQDSLKLIQQRKDITVRAELSRQKSIRNGSFAGAGMLMLIAIGAIYSFKRKQRDNKIITAEKKRSDDLLLNILPAEVADELKATGQAHAKQFNDVSVLFTDFVNFTAAAESLSPSELVLELHECFTAFDSIIERHGLEKIKTIGDSYMAVCGLPNPDDEHATKTIRAGIDIRDFIEQRKQKKDTFDIRIGINSGAVVAGIVGVKKFAYDIWGDAVNIASRMESGGMAGKVNVSQATQDAAGDTFNFEHRGRVGAKNKGSIDMYFAENKS